MSTAPIEPDQAIPAPVADPPPQQGSGKSEAELALIAESKKYRGRAQEAEAKLLEQESSAKALKEARLAEEGKIKELNESLTTERDSLIAERDELKAIADKVKEDEATEREELLGKLPEDDRGLYDGITVPNLRKIVAKATEILTPGANTNRPQGGNNEKVPFRADMTPEEKKAWLQEKVDAAGK